MRDVLTIAHLTLFEARRRHIVAAAAVCGGAFLAVFAAGFFAAYRDSVSNQIALQRQASLTLMTIAGLYAANFLSVLLAVLLPVDTLSGEIESGVMQTLASKPVRRADIVLGKWLGHWIVLVAYLLLLCGGVLLTGRLIASYAQTNITVALPLMLLEVTLLMTVSIAGGTRFSTVTNGILALGFYGIAFIGGYVEQIAGFAGLDSARVLGVAVSLLSPADALWRMGAYYMQPAIVRDIGAAVFSTASVPTPLMVWWAAGFTLLMLIVAVRSFTTRQL